MWYLHGTIQVSLKSVLTEAILTCLISFLINALLNHQVYGTKAQWLNVCGLVRGGTHGYAK